MSIKIYRDRLTHKYCLVFRLWGTYYTQYTIKGRWIRKIRKIRFKEAYINRWLNR